MRAKIIALILGLAAVPVVALANPVTTFSSIYSFGDSLSDPGNASIFTLTKYPGANYATRNVPNIPFPAGYYTNGPNTTPGTASPTGLWIDQLAADLGVSDPLPVLGGGTNYSFASAQTGLANPQDMGFQVGAFLTSHLTGASSSALYAFWGGANDIFDGANPVTAANNIFREIQSVAGEGAKYFLWLNLPALGDTPLGSLDSTALNQATAAFNLQWSKDVGTLDAEGLDVIGVNVAALFSSIVSDPAAYGFSNVTSPAQGVTGANVNQYLFWDPEHPTTEGDMYVADLALSDLKGVPEPASCALMLLGCGGIISWYRRRAKA